MRVNKKSLRKLTGRTIYVINKEKIRITGKLVRVSGKKLYLQPTSIGNKKVKTSAILPLVLFDLLAVGTSPYALGYGYPGYGVGYPGGVVGGLAPGYPYPGIGYGAGYGGYTGFY